MHGIDLIRVVCPSCAKRLRVKADRVGQQIRCPNKECGTSLLVPFASDSDDQGQSLSGPLKTWLWLLAGGIVGMLVVGLVMALMSGGEDRTALPGKPVAQVKKPTTPVPLPQKTPPEKTLPLPESKPEASKPAVGPEPKEKTPSPPPPSPPETPPPGKRPSSAPEDNLPPMIKPMPSRPVQPIPEKEPKKAEPQKKRQPPQDNQYLMLPLKALGKTTRLEKLKAVRIEGKVSFSHTTKLNNIILMWCWDPRIVIRFEEDMSDGPLQDLQNVLAKARQRTGKSEEKLLVDAMKKEIKKLYLDAKTAKRYEDEIRKLARQGDYRPLFYSIWMIENTTAYTLFNDRIRLRASRDQIVEMRNICFALSVSNLLPLKRHAFEIKPAADAQVKARNCSHFKVQDPSGADLDFYFDKQTELLAKIAHWGPSRRKGGPPKVRWEHYFSDYREIDGLKQWHKLQIQHDGVNFAAIDVNNVQYSDSVLPELRRGDPDAQELAKKAAELLANARETIRDGNVRLGMVRLRIIVMDYAQTPAAAEAARLLKALQTPKE